MNKDELYIERCFTLARKVNKSVKSNPQVGAVLVYNDVIIGEGFHQFFGGAHAEVNAVNSVSDQNKKHIPHSTLYVSLEPCSIERKTPPCTDLILKSGIKKVVISCIDPNPDVNHSGLNKLRAHGITVKTGVLKEKGEELIKPFLKNLSNRPFVSLKWAKTANNFMGHKDKQIWLSNKYSQLFAHKLRAENDGILIGTNTAILDNPKLTTRLVNGDHPVRIVLDRRHRIPKESYLFADEHSTIIVTSTPIELDQLNKENLVLDFDSTSFLDDLLKVLFEKEICRLLVEGGSKLLSSFIKANLWDQAHIIQTKKEIDDGIKSPHLQGKLIDTFNFEDDHINLISNIND